MPKATTHGHLFTVDGRTYQSPTYKSWAAMKGRVNGNVGTHACYAGTTMDPRWAKFDVFLADMGVRPEGTSLDRKDNTKGYWPDNCRWADPATQSQNRRPWKHTPEGLARINARHRLTLPATE